MMILWYVNDMLMHDTLQKPIVWHKKWSTLACTHLDSFIYLINTRPYLLFLVNCISMFMSAPQQPHLDAIHRILWYIKTTTNHIISK
jgi:hypothetical protein